MRLRLAVNNTTPLAPPPHDLDTEAAWHGIWLCDPESYPALRNHGVEPKHFYSHANQRIAEAAEALHEAGELPTLTAVKGWLEDHRQLGRVGGTKYLGSLMIDTSAVSMSASSLRLRDLHRARRALEVAQRLATAIRERRWEQGPQELLDAATRSLRDLAYANPGARGTATATDAIAEGMRAHIAQQAEPVRSTGFPRLDYLLDGGLRNECIALLADEGIGKSSLSRSLALSVAQSVDADGNRTSGAAIVALEMPREQVALMGLAQLSGVPYRRVRRGEFTESEWPAFEDARRTLAATPWLINDDAKAKPGRKAKAVTPDRLRDLAFELQAEFEARGARLSVVVFDLLQAITPADGESDFDAIKRASRILRDLPAELGATIIVVSHTNPKNNGEAWGYPKLRGDMECVWRLRKAKGNAPSYAGPSRPAYGEPTHELVIEKMRVPMPEDAPCIVELVGDRETMTWREA